MKKIFWLVVVCAMYSPLALASNFQWAYTVGGTGSENAYNVGVDQAGNIYQTGTFGSAFDFDPGPGEDIHTPATLLDIFVSKLNADGSYAWTRQFDGACARRSGIAVYPNGDTVITNAFMGTKDLDPTEGVDMHTAVGNCDAFVVKLNADGSFAWARTFGGTSEYFTYDQGIAAAVDYAGNILIAGEFDGVSNPADLDPSSEGVDLHSGSYFISKFSSSGGYIWGRSYLISPYNNSAVAIQRDGITTDANGNVILVGSFQGQADFDPSSNGVDQRTSVGGSRDIFVTSLDADGNYRWTYTDNNSASFSDLLHSVVADQQGNIYASGFVGSSALPFNGFSLKVSSSGTLQWMYRISTQSNGSNSGSLFLSIAVDSNDDPIMVGSFDASTDFDPSGNHDIRTPTGRSDTSILRLHSNGSYKSTETIGGSGTANASAYGIYLDSQDNAAITGSYSGTVDFDPGIGDESRSSVLSSNGTPSVDIYTLKLAPNHAPVLNPIGNKSVLAGKRLRFTVSATDADETDGLHFSAQNLPQGASFVDNGNRTATFNWIPSINQIGVYHPIFEVNDGELSDFEPVTITVFGPAYVTAATRLPCEPPNC